MREIRQSGSEGGVAQINAPSLPLSWESPDYELHRLTERSPEFFDETVRRHLESKWLRVESLKTMSSSPLTSHLQSDVRHSHNRLTGNLSTLNFGF